MAVVASWQLFNVMCRNAGNGPGEKSMTMVHVSQNCIKKIIGSDRDIKSIQRSSNLSTESHPVMMYMKYDNFFTMSWLNLQY